MRNLNQILDELMLGVERDGIQKILVGALIYRDSKILLLERAKGEFLPGLIELPSGGIDAGETLLEGLIREVYEETGLIVSRVKKYIDYFDYRSGSGKLARQFNFEIEVWPGDIQLNPKEHSRFFFAEPRLADHFYVDSGEDDLKSLRVSEEVCESIRRNL